MIAMADRAQHVVTDGDGGLAETVRHLGQGPRRLLAGAVALALVGAVDGQFCRTVDGQFVGLGMARKGAE